jgi:hypothetical protein
VRWTNAHRDTVSRSTETPARKALLFDIFGDE